MPIQRMVRNAWHIKEFYEGFNGTCTQTSAAMCLASALGAPASHDEVVQLMLSMTKAMIGRGDNPTTGASANGAATVTSMAYELRAQGADVATEWDYAGDQMPHDWHSVLKDNAGIRPILLQLSNAQGLSDITGHGEDAGVHYHAIAVMGIADEGYVVGDPNNPTVEQTFDIYPYPALQAAQPCGLIMLNMKGAEPVATLPAGWTDANGVITAPNGHTVHGGIGAWLRANPGFISFAGEPIEEERESAAVGMDPANGHGWEQLFNCGGIAYVEKEGAARPLWVGAMCQVLGSQLANANARLAEPPTVVVSIAEQKAVAALAALKDALSA